MRHSFRWTTRQLTSVMLLVLASSAAVAEEGDASVDEGTRVETTTGAGRFLQTTVAAPAAVTVITAEDIRAYNWRTLSDALRSVPGFYVSDDRSRHSIGARGIGMPNDPSSRVLFIVDGHRLNEPLDDTVDPGLGFPVALDAIERIEIVRGPMSSLYGSNAELAVVHITTKRGRDLDGGAVSVGGGNLDTYRGSAQAGGEAGPVEWNAALGGYATNGQNDLYYPELDEGTVGSGQAENLDAARALWFSPRVSFADFTLSSVLHWRDKEVPTGAFGVEQNDPRNAHWEARAWLDLQYQKIYFDSLEVFAQVFYDGYQRGANRPIDRSETESPKVFVNRDEASASSWGTQLRVATVLFGHRLVGGFEGRHGMREHQLSFDLDSDTAPYFDDTRMSLNVGVFVQDDFEIFMPELRGHASLRYDYFASGFGAVNPRLGLTYQPWTTTALKLVYGRGYREPNAVERLFVVPTQPATVLDPEVVDTLELIGEHHFGPAAHVLVSLYASQVGDRIARSENPNVGTQYSNKEQLQALGAEIEVGGQFTDFLSGSVSYTTQVSGAFVTVDPFAGEFEVLESNPFAAFPLPNSPQHMLKARGAWALTKMFQLTADTQLLAPRAAIAGPGSEPVALVNAHLRVRDIVPGLEGRLGVYNLLDWQYSDPVSDATAQTLIKQDGRTFFGSVEYAF